jgi:hypothetical protein
MADSAEWPVLDCRLVWSECVANEWAVLDAKDELGCDE